MKALTEETFLKILNEQENNFEITQKFKDFLLNNSIIKIENKPWKTKEGFWHNYYETNEKLQLNNGDKVPFICIRHHMDKKSEYTTDKNGHIVVSKPTNILKSLELTFFRTHNVIEKKTTKSFWGKEKIEITELQYQYRNNCLPFCVQPEIDIEHYAAYNPELLIPFENLLEVINDERTLLDEKHKQFMKEVFTFFKTIISNHQ
jgi:hypothetical protein